MDEMQRQHLVTRKDLTNLQKKFGLREFEKSSNDMESVHVWVEEHKTRQETGEITRSPFFCFHPLIVDGGIFTLGN